MRHLFDRPLGACAPNGSLFKCNGAAAAMAGDLATALIGGWFSARNTENAAVMQHNSNRILQKWQQAYTQQNMADQYKYDMWAWNENNQYNSPRAQMERLRAAGLNPYLVMQGASGGSMPQGAAPNTHVGPQGASASSPAVQPAQMPRLNTASLLIQSSQIKNQQIEAFARLADSAPSLVKAVGSDGAKSILSSAFGQTVDTQWIEQFVDNELAMQGAQRTKQEVEASIASEFGVKAASTAIAVQEQSFNKMAAEIGLMSSQRSVNEVEIERLASEYIRNLADAWKLRKEGDYFVANAKTVNALRNLTLSDLETQVQRSKFENRIKGYYDGSGLDNYLKTDYHSKKTKDILRIEENAQGSELVKALDRVLGKYLKVSGGM